jgi:hypothetical protein
LPGRCQQPAEIGPFQDGKLDSTKASTHVFRISVINNRLTGANTDAAWSKKGHMVGEVAPGKTPIIVIRQDGTEPKDVVAYYSGKMTQQGVFEGTVHDTEGSSNAFRLTLQKQE